MMASELLQSYLEEVCPEIHAARLQALMDVADGLQKSNNLSLTAMGRGLKSSTDIKHKVKKVDRLESNKHLYKELDKLYEGLSGYIFTYTSFESNLPIIIDLCFLKDNKDIQMLSAELALKGRSLPLYRDVFKSGELKSRAKSFLDKVSLLLPADADVVFIMDAGFGNDWFQEIEKHTSWYWVTRIRQGKSIKLSPDDEWMDSKDLFEKINVRAKAYNQATIMKTHNRPCRLVTKRNTSKNTKGKYNRQPRNYHAGNADYQRSAKEPWIIASNLPAQFTTTQILNFYKKRMQIEESFRDVKSHQYGLSARYSTTRCVYRWSIKMLLAALVQVICWVIGIIGHSQGFQRKFQANTVKDKRVFSYFYLGLLILQYDKLDELIIDYENLPHIIQNELNREW